MTDAEQVPTTECRVCHTDVPAGDFCGLCGCHLTRRRWEGPDWLRIRDFSAAPNENVLSPSLASSLFPQLAHRGAFRLGLAALLVSIVACAVLRLPAALVAVAVLGMPTLFLIYLRESDAFRDLPARTVALTAVLGIALGIGWVLLSGAVAAPSSSVAVGAGVGGAQMLRDGVAIPLGAAILVMLPALIVRLLGPPTREALDGFMSGALGSLMCTGAATLTRLIPQLRTGVVSKTPMSHFLVEAGIRGITVPLIAAAAGGLIGAALWFRRPENTEHQHPGAVRLVLVSFATAVLLVYVSLGLVDVSRMGQWLMLAVYVAVAVVALMALRLGLHLALLHEAHDEIAADEPLLCSHCGHIVPDMAFCPACGVATRASSRSSRALRRSERPQRVDPEPEQQ